MAKIRIKWVKSAIGFAERQKRTVEHEDTPQIRGMIEHVRHLVVWTSDN